jgi:hypothetical protein
MVIIEFASQRQNYSITASEGATMAQMSDFRGIHLQGLHSNTSTMYTLSLRVFVYLDIVLKHRE